MPKLIGTDIVDGDDYQAITDTPEIWVGPSTITSSVSSTTVVMSFVATAPSSAVAVTPAINTNSSIYFFPCPHVGGLNSSGVSLQDPHIQRQNPYQPILYLGMPEGDSYQPTGPPPLW